jgi:hypothetical protein
MFCKESKTVRRARRESITTVTLWKNAVSEAFFDFYSGKFKEISNK